MNTSNIELPETYLALSALRKNDIYHPDMEQDSIIADFFPPTFPELVQRLSDITGAFYGGLLQQAGLLFGEESINKLSSAFLYDLGSKTAARNLAVKPNLKADIHGVAKVFIGTVFTSSPEFTFEMIELNDHELKMLVKGVDRYHKIAQNFQMADKLEWPVIKPFVQGVCDGMKLNVTFEMDVRELHEDSSCCYYINIVQQ